MKETKIALFECQKCKSEFYVGDMSSEYCEDLFCPLCKSVELKDLGTNNVDCTTTQSIIKSTGNKKYVCNDCEREFLTNGNNEIGQKEVSCCAYCSTHNIFKLINGMSQKQDQLIIYRPKRVKIARKII